MSLAVDYQRHPGDEIPTLPNLTYKVFQGDSIVDHLIGKVLQSNEGRFRIDNFSANESIRQKLNKIKALKDNYFNETDEDRKKKLENQITEDRMRVAIEILEYETPVPEQTSFLEEGEKFNIKKAIQKIESDSKQELIARLKSLLAAKNFSILHSSDEKLSFVWMIDLVEHFIDHGQEGFDIVIGNPPYGVKNEVMNKGRVRYGLGNDDSYGVFIAMAFQDLLKTGGIISFITSDTWQTIKTHKSLRRFLLDNSFVHHLLLMPTWLFGATVNTSILIATKSEQGNPKEKQGERIVFENSSKREKNELIACDFTRAGENTGELEEYLYSLDNPEYISTPKKAIFHYKQGLIETNSNWPFFVGSPKLFALMNDTTCKTIEKEIGEKEKKRIEVRQIEFNGKTIEISNFGATYTKINNKKIWNNDGVAKIVSGIKTGNNDKYLRITSKVDKSFDLIEPREVLDNDEIQKLTEDEKLNGVNKLKKHFIAFEMGKSSDTEDGVMPNYYQEPTSVFIDWSTEAVANMRQEAHSDLANEEFRFKKGLSFSFTGQYSPTFRISIGELFVNAASRTYSVLFGNDFLLGVLCSKLQRYFMRNIINHTVNFGVDDLKDTNFPVDSNQKMQELVSQIIEKQKQNPRYDYMSNEQKEIDKLVYEIYGLKKEDIREVEIWYARRYPKLARFCDVN